MSAPIVGRLRTQWRRWKGQVSGKSRRRRNASRRSQLEGLEPRALLASVTEYPVPGLSRSNGGAAAFGPDQIVAGPDGNLWFTYGKYGLSDIGEVTTSGKFTTYPCNTCNGLEGITNGPDGALWFNDTCLAIGRITTSGQITEFPVGPDSPDYGIVTGPDGALWFTDFGAAYIGRITTAGQLTMYPLPSSASYPYQITVGSDGALWFTEHTSPNGEIGRITTSGQVTMFQPNLSLRNPKGS